MELILILSVVFFLVISFEIIVGINWNCVIGKHSYVYVGQKHGMTMRKDKKGVVGSQRNMYKCSHCEKDKPTEKKDYTD
jgi:hypothetical protein